MTVIVLTGNWMGKNFDEIALFPFWRTIADLGAVIYVHGNPFNCQVNDHVPSTYTLGWERMRRLHISNYLGFASKACCAVPASPWVGCSRSFPTSRSATSSLVARGCPGCTTHLTGCTGLSHSVRVVLPDPASSCGRLF